MTNKTIFFYAVFFLSVGLTVYLIFPLLSVVVLALITSTLAQPLYTRLSEIRLTHRIAAPLTLGIIALTILVPLTIIVQVSIQQVGMVNKDINNLTQGKEVNLAVFIDRVNIVLERMPYVDYRLDESIVIERITSLVRPTLDFFSKRVVAIGTASAQFMTRLILFFILVGAMVPNFDKLARKIEQLSLLDMEDDHLYYKRFNAMAVSMVRGSLVIALVQGGIAGITLWFIGVPYAFFLTLLCILLSLVPLGAGVVLVPASIVFLLLGQIWPAVILTVVNFLIIANVDNILRPLLVLKDAALHPALLLLSVFGGLATFGFLGVIYGPIIMIMCITSFEVYERRGK